MYSHFYSHLCAATAALVYAQNISNDHPAVEIFHDLETRTYYVQNLTGHLEQRIIHTILKWTTNMLDLDSPMKVGALNLPFFF